MQDNFAFELRLGERLISIRPAGRPHEGYAALLDGVVVAAGCHPHEALGLLLSAVHGTANIKNCAMVSL